MYDSSILPKTRYSSTRGVPSSRSLVVFGRCSGSRRIAGESGQCGTLPQRFAGWSADRRMRCTVTAMPFGGMRSAQPRAYGLKLNAALSTSAPRRVSTPKSSIKPTINAILPASRIPSVSWSKLVKTPTVNRNAI